MCGSSHPTVKLVRIVTILFYLISQEYKPFCNYSVLIAEVSQLKIVYQENNAIDTVFIK